MVSLKSLVSGISILLFFASFIVGPQGLGAPYVFLLSLLPPAAEQNHETVTVPSEVNSITGSEIDTVLVQPGSNAFALDRLPCSIRVRAIATLAAA